MGCLMNAVDHAIHVQCRCQRIRVSTTLARKKMNQSADILFVYSHNEKSVEYLFMGTEFFRYCSTL